MANEIITQGENYAIFNRSSHDNLDNRLHLIMKNPNPNSQVAAVECFCTKVPPLEIEISYSVFLKDRSFIPPHLLADRSTSYYDRGDIGLQVLKALKLDNAQNAATRDELNKLVPEAMRAVEAFEKVAPQLLEKTAEEQRKPVNQALLKPVIDAVSEGQGRTMVPASNPVRPVPSTPPTE
ncbi:MAG: hypothetical protein EBR02_07575 [Alphaproteobacteria bacterium]|nr:hypothetical protein [Alphaproteobacteria bacterium]